jgi:hypothetical protein
MPDATITSTASTFGTISGTFAADQSTIVGTVSGIIPGTLTGSVGVPGPAGPAGIGLPAGGTSGQFLQKTSGVDYATDWVTVNLTGLATESWVTAGFYPLTGNPSSFLTASALTPYLTSATASTTYQTLAGMSSYLAKADNLSGLASTSTARTNLGLGSLAVVNDAPSDGSQYARKNGAWDVVSVPASYITSVSSPLSVTTGNLSIDLSAYAPLASPVLTGNPQSVTPTFGDNDTSISTTAFVQAALAGGTAVARNLEVEVRNQSGSTIAAGSIVYISGATGNKPLITLAQANNDANSAQTIGFVKTSIANNGTGYVIVRGELENIDTSALTEGVQLYLSPTTAGTWTTTKPSAPQHLVYVGIVIRSHPTLGTILVAVQNGYELGEIHDVALSGLANNDLLAYESSTDLWKNKTYSALGLLTSADAATTYAPKASPTFTGVATFDNPGNFVIVVPGSGTGYDTRIESNVYSMRNAGIEVIRIGAGGIKYPDGVTQTVAFPGFTGYAPLASPALTGNVTITSNSTGAALFIEQSGTGNILTLHDQATDTTFVAIDANGKINTVVADATTAGLNVPHTTVAPSAPVNGDIWTTTGGLFVRINAGTQQFAALSTNNTFSNASSTYGSSTATGTINVASGATISASTKTVNVATGGVVGSTTLTTIGPVLGDSTTSIGGTTAASTLNLATGATLTATTKAVNIGTAGVAGSTTNIAIGSTTGTSTTTLQGITNGVTQSAGDSSLKLATTAFVTTADNLKANLASPTFTGTPAAPTATPGTNTTQIATTAFVQQEVPAASTTAAGKVELATNVEAYAATSSSLVTTPLGVQFGVAQGLSQRLDYLSTTAISGSGAVTYYAGFREMYTSATASAGRASFLLGGHGAITYSVFGSNSNEIRIDFSKKILMAGRIAIAVNSTYVGDANGMALVTLGGYTNFGTGNMGSAGIGLRKAGGTSSVIELIVHNGTTFTSVNTTKTLAAREQTDYMIYSDGAGSVSLYIEGALAATTTAGPTSVTPDWGGLYREQVEQTASAAVRYSMHCYGGYLYQE